MFFILFYFFKYYADVENCGASRDFGFIYIYINIMLTWKIVVLTEVSVLYIYRLHSYCNTCI